MATTKKRKVNAECYDSGHNRYCPTGRFRSWDNCRVGHARGTAVSGSHAGHYTRGGLVGETVLAMKNVELTFEKLRGLPLDVGAAAMVELHPSRKN